MVFPFEKCVYHADRNQGRCRSWAVSTTRQVGRRRVAAVGSLRVADLSISELGVAIVPTRATSRFASCSVRRARNSGKRVRPAGMYCCS
jgi:hypothetical protein